jgi:hypothetical protein
MWSGMRITDWMLAIRVLAALPVIVERAARRRLLRTSGS